jgi:hypothetical protein
MKQKNPIILTTNDNFENYQTNKIGLWNTIALDAKRIEDCNTAYLYFTTQNIIKIKLQIKYVQEIKRLVFRVLEINEHPIKLDELYSKKIITFNDTLEGKRYLDDKNGVKLNKLWKDRIKNQSCTTIEVL